MPLFFIKCLQLSAYAVWIRIFTKNHPHFSNEILNSLETTLVYSEWDEILSCLCYGNHEKTFVPVCNYLQQPIFVVVGFFDGPNGPPGGRGGGPPFGDDRCVKSIYRYVSTCHWNTDVYRRVVEMSKHRLRETLLCEMRSSDKIYVRFHEFLTFEPYELCIQFAKLS